MKMTKLAALRKSRGLTQTELANICGWKKSTISDYERGERNPNIEKLKILATALQCTITELI